MLTPKFLAKRDVSVQVSKGLDENGSHVIEKIIDTKARIESSNNIVYLKDGKKKTLKMKLFIFDKIDEIPETLEGFCIVDGEKYTIELVGNYYNPNGKKNHVLLGLI